jgi:hypothetical protein
MTMLVLNMVLAVVFSVYDGLAEANEDLADIDPHALLAEMLPCLPFLKPAHMDADGDGIEDSQGDSQVSSNDLEAPVPNDALEEALSMDRELGGVADIIARISTTDLAAQ